MRLIILECNDPVLVVIGVIYYCLLGRKRYRLDYSKNIKKDSFSYFLVLPSNNSYDCGYFISLCFTTCHIGLNMSWFI